MVTIKNDIESSGSFLPTTQPVKDVNLKQQGGRQSRRRSYRCVTIVSVVVLLLLAVGIGSVLYFGTLLNRIPTEANDGSPSSTPRAIVAVSEDPSPTVPPGFSDPFDGTSDGPEIAVSPTDDDEFDIDGPPASTTDTASSATTTTTTTQSTIWIDVDEGSGSNYKDDYDEDDDDDSLDHGAGSGSGSGYGGLRDS